MDKTIDKTKNKYSIEQKSVGNSCCRQERSGKLFQGLLKEGFELLITEYNQSCQLITFFIRVKGQVFSFINVVLSRFEKPLQDFSDDGVVVVGAPILRIFGMLQKVVWGCTYSGEDF